MQRGSSGAGRKLVVLLFADIVSSTQRLESMDPEDVHDALNAAVELMLEPVRRFDGMVARVQGDGVLSIFGVDAASEDDALRACLCGQAIVSNFAVSDQAVLANERLQVRVGIHVGSVVFHHTTYGTGSHFDVSGAVVNQAAHVEKMCPIGSVALSEDAANLVVGKIEVKPLGEIAGGPDTATRKVVELVSVSPEYTLVHQFAQPGMAPLIGREKEYRRLKDAVGMLAVQGRQIALIGEAGIGKSRLSFELRQYARAQGLDILEVRGLSFLNATSYGALRSVAMHALGMAEEVSEAALTANQAAFNFSDMQVMALRDLFGFRIADPAYISMESRERTDLIADAMCGLLLGARPETRRLLVIEDIHFLDTYSLEVVARLVDVAAHLPVLTLMTGRLPSLDIAQGMVEEVILLDPMGEDDARELVAILVSGDEVKPQVTDEVIHRAEGNPFVLMEYLRAIRANAEGGLKRLPVSVDASILARMDRLAAESRRLLETLTIAGGALPMRILAAACEDVDMVEGLFALRRAGFIAPPNADTVTMQHDILLTACHESLLKADRRAYHGAILKAYEGIDDAVQSPDRLAYHARESGAPEQAIEYYWEAMLAEASRSGVIAVTNLYSSALEMCDQIGPAADMRRAELTMMAFDALQQQGLYSLLREQLERAIASTAGSGNRRLRAHAHAHKATMAWLEASHEEAIIATDTALEIAEADNVLPLIVYASFTRANALHSLGKLDEAIALHMSSIERLSGQTENMKLGSIGFPSVISRAFAIWYLTQKGDFSRAQTLIPRGLQLAEVYSQPYSIILMYTAIGLHAFARGRFPKAIETLRACYDICLDERVYAMACRVCSSLAQLYVRVGRADEALDMLEHMFAEGLHLKGGRSNWTITASALAEAWAALGEYKWADSAANIAIALAENNSEQSDALQAKLVKCEIQLNARKRLQSVRATLEDVKSGAKQYKRSPLAAAAQGGLALLALIEQRADAESDLELACAAYAALDLQNAAHALSEAAAHIQAGKQVRYHSNVV